MNGDQLQELARVEHNPLWMPKGSVRALMALALVGATIASAFLLPEIAVGLLTLTTIVIKDYYKARADGL